ncbi:MAG: CapA family protein, partial [Bauldia litoralis]
KDKVRATPVAAKGGTYRIVAVGDTMIGSDFPSPILYAPLTRDAAPAKILGPTLARLLAPGRNKVVFANVEGTIHSRAKPHKTCRSNCYVFRMPPHYAGILKRVGFNLVSLANNHAGDFLAPGRRATFRNLQKVGMKAAGIDMPGMRTATLVLSDGTKVGLAAFAPNPGTLPINNLARATKIVRDLSRRVDIAIVSFHGGAEGMHATRVPRRMEIAYGERRGDVYRFAHAMVNAGADVVIGHGPHVPRGVEVYKRRFIAYSLGNFWTYGRFNIRSIAGQGPVVDIRVDKQGRVVAARIHSTRQHSRGVPRYDPTGAAARTVAGLTAKDFPEAKLRFDAKGRITGPGIRR